MAGRWRERGRAVAGVGAALLLAGSGCAAGSGSGDASGGEVDTAEGGDAADAASLTDAGEAGDGVEEGVPIFTVRFVAAGNQESGFTVTDNDIASGTLYITVDRAPVRAYVHLFGNAVPHYPEPAPPLVVDLTDTSEIPLAIEARHGVIVMVVTTEPIMAEPPRQVWLRSGPIAVGVGKIWFDTCEIDADCDDRTPLTIDVCDSYGKCSHLVVATEFLEDPSASCLAGVSLFDHPWFLDALGGGLEVKTSCGFGDPWECSWYLADNWDNALSQIIPAECWGGLQCSKFAGQWDYRRYKNLAAPNVPYCVFDCKACMTIRHAIPACCGP